MQVKTLLLSLLWLSLLAGHSFARQGAVAYAQHPKVPIHFTQNMGQITDQYQHVRRDIDARMQASNGLQVFVGAGQLHYQWHTQASAGLPSQSYRMDVSLLGANHHVEAKFEEVNTYIERYYLAATSNGLTAQSYKRLRYHNIYPNIDWVLYTQDGQLKYDFIVHPGGKVADIQLQYGGATSLTLDGGGNLRAETPMGTVSEQAPVSYTQEGKAIGSRYLLQGNVLSFHTEPYRGTLVIDPAVVWSTYMGGLGNDQPAGVVTDAAGNVYIAGGTLSSDNIATVGAYQQSYAGTGLGSYVMGDAFLSKFDPAGNCLWSTYYGGSDEDRGLSLAIHAASGRVYLAGSTMSTAGIATAGAHQSLNAGGADAFLACFDTAGQRVWATYYGGPSQDGDTYTGLSTACDTAGNVYLCGVTESSTGIATAGSHQASKAANTDGFLVKFSAAGVRQWGSYLGTEGADQANKIVCDSAGNVVLCGSTDGLVGLTTTGSYQPVHAGLNDAFLMQWSPLGTVNWATYFGGSGYDDATALIIGAAGKIYVAGATESLSGIAGTSSFQPAFGGGPLDGMLAAFSSNGQLDWATYYGGTDIDVATGLVCSPQQEIYMVGYTISNTGMVTAGSLMDTLYNSTSESFIARFNATGQRNWASYYGGSGYEINTYAALGLGGALYLCGQSSSAEGLATTGAYQALFGGGDNDTYLARIQVCDAANAPTAITGPATVCAGETYTYSVPTVNGATAYNWTIPGGWSGASTSASISVTVGSAGGVLSVLAHNDCSPSDTVAMTISVLPAPVPVIVANNNVLSTTMPYTSYQWLRNNVDIAGATSATYVATVAGSYTVSVTATNGCRAISDAISMGGVGVEERNKQGLVIQVFPNPTRDRVQVKTATPVWLQLSCMDGRVLVPAHKASSLSLEHVANGLYLLQIFDEAQILLHTQKLSKQ